MLNKQTHRNVNSKTKVGTRTCFVCKTSAPREVMLRFVKQDGQQIRFDAQEVLPGRGMWVHVDKNCLSQAIDKKLFHKVAKGMVSVPKDLMTVVERELQYNPNKQKLFLEGISHE